MLNLWHGTRLWYPSFSITAFTVFAEQTYPISKTIASQESRRVLASLVTKATRQAVSTLLKMVGGRCEFCWMGCHSLSLAHISSITGRLVAGTSTNSGHFRISFVIALTTHYSGVKIQTTYRWVQAINIGKKKTKEASFYIFWHIHQSIPSSFLMFPQDYWVLSYSEMTGIRSSRVVSICHYLLGAVRGFLWLSCFAFSGIDDFWYPGRWCVVVLVVKLAVSGLFPLW